MQFIERTTDVITGSSNLEDLHKVSNFPVFMGAVEHDQSADLTADMTWSISQDSGLIQLKRLLPIDLIYQAQTTTSAIGSTWMAHHKEFAAFVRKFEPNGVFEIGGAHGILSVEYGKITSIPWTILEPNPAPVKGCRAKFIKGYFNNAFTFRGSFDTVIHSHVFEHLYEPSEFIKHLSAFVKEGQYMIFSVPDLKTWLERKFTNCINFEHTVFLTEPYIDYLLAKNEFRVIEKKRVMDGHSIFYAVIRDPIVTPIPLPHGLYNLNKNTYLDFVKYYEDLVFSINIKIKNPSRPIYLFGAHIFSQHLIVMGLNTKNIDCILDNDKNKHGKRLYGTGLTIRSPLVLSEIKNPLVILKAGIYNKEIKEDILNNINNKTIFIE